MKTHEKIIYEIFGYIIAVLIAFAFIVILTAAALFTTEEVERERAEALGGEITAGNIITVLEQTEAYSEAVTTTDETAKDAKNNTTFNSIEFEAVKPIETDRVTETDDEWVSIGMFTLTAYCPCPLCCGVWSADHPSRVGTEYVQRTASGTIPEAGRTVGADTDMLPFGTVVLIDGHEYVVEDTGAGAVGKRLVDVYCDTHAETIAFGRRTAEVWVKR